MVACVGLNSRQPVNGSIIGGTFVHVFEVFRVVKECARGPRSWGREPRLLTRQAEIGERLPGGIVNRLLAVAVLVNKRRDDEQAARYIYIF